MYPQASRTNSLSLSDDPYVLFSALLFHRLRLLCECPTPFSHFHTSCSDTACSPVILNFIAFTLEMNSSLFLFSLFSLLSAGVGANTSWVDWLPS